MFKCKKNFVFQLFFRQGKINYSDRNFLKDFLISLISIITYLAYRVSLLSLVIMWGNYYNHVVFIFDFQNDTLCSESDWIWRLYFNTWLWRHWNYFKFLWLWFRVFIDNKPVVSRGQFSQMGRKVDSIYLFFKSIT